MTRNVAARGLCVVLITCPSKPVALKLARWMIRGHAAACVNVLGPAESIFWWQGRVDHAREYLLIVKTARQNLPALRRGLTARHPYTVPELVALPISDGLPAYLDWVRSSCRSKKSAL